MTTVRELAARAKAAARRMAYATGREKRAALLAAAELLEQERGSLLAANAEDLRAAREAGMSGAKYDRLRLDEKTLVTLQAGLRQLAEAPEVVGEIEAMRTLPNGLQVGRMRVPLGLVGFIYESRPGATVEAAGLGLRRATRSSSGAVARRSVPTGRWWGCCGGRSARPGCRRTRLPWCPPPIARRCWKCSGSPSSST